MKIGILTLPLHTNYGGILQAYALLQILENAGHDASIISKSTRYTLPIWKKIPVYMKSAFQKYILNKKNVVFLEKYSEILRQNTDIFINNKMKLTNDIMSYDSVNEKMFDAIIVGSDQIWRPKYLSPIENAYLRFTKGWSIKRISYAPSFGTDQWEYSDEEVGHCKELLTSFDAVSVREDTGVALCRKYFNIDSTHVLDPTMLLSRNDYISLIKKETNLPASKGDLFVYVLNGNEVVTCVINKLVTDYNYKPYFSSTDSVKADIHDRKTIKVESWLKSFYDSKIVVTDSFHACVFCIIFNKPFLVYKNVSRGTSRFDSLLRMFGLEDRIIHDDIRKTEMIINKEIDWDDVNKKLDDHKAVSKSFLKKALI